MKRMSIAMVLLAVFGLAFYCYADSRDLGRRAGEATRRGAQEGKNFGEGFKEGISGSGCFIATAVYGSYNAPNVRTFRSFRDHCLLKNEVGRGCVRFYYKHGPHWAGFIQEHPVLRTPIRTGLDGVAYILRLTGVADSPPQQ